MKSQFFQNGRRLWWLLLVVNVAVLLFVISPLFWVVAKGLHVDALQRLFAREDLLAAATNSLLLALGASVGATLCGTLIAFGLPQLSEKSRKLVRATIILPMVLPEIALGISFLVLFMQMHWALGWSTLIASHIAFSLSYATLIMAARVSLVDQSLLDASRDLGANSWQAFRHALWPQLVPGIVASLVSCFSLSLDDFLISFFVKGVEQVTLPVQIFSMVRIKIGPEIYALSSVLFCISLAGVLLSQLCLKKSFPKSSSSKLSSS